MVSAAKFLVDISKAKQYKKVWELSPELCDTNNNSNNYSNKINNEVWNSKEVELYRE